MRAPIVMLLLFTAAYAQDTVRLTLAESIGIALKESPYVIRYTADRERAAAAVWTSLGAALPRLTIFSGYDRSGPESQFFFEFPGAAPTPTQTISGNEFSAGVTASQSLLDFASWWRIRQARRTALAAKATFRSSRADLAFDITQRYFELVRQHQNFEVTRVAVTQDEEQALIARERFRLGAISRPELLRVEVGFSQRRIDLITVRATIENTRRELAGLLGINRPIAIDTSLSFPDTAASTPALDSLLGLALEMNPAFQAATIAHQAQLINKRAVWLEKVPNLAGSFTYGATRPFFDRLLGDWGEGDFWAVSLQLTWNIFEGLGWYGRLKEAAAGAWNTEADRRIAENAAIEEMRQAWSNLRTAREGLALIGDLREQARLQYELTMQKYRLGAASALDLVTSQLDYIEAQRRANGIIIDYYLASARIDRILGMLWRSADADALRELQP